MRFFAIIVSAALVASAARAEEVAGFTLEWLADTCPYIGVYRVQSTSPIDSDPSHYLHIVSSLTGALRGEPPKDFAFEYPGPGPGCNEGQVDPAVGDRFLIFLRDAGPKDIRWEQIISLARPAKHCYPYVALRPDFTLLTDGKQIERIVRDRIAKRPLKAMGWREYPRDLSSVEIPPGTPADEAINAGSRCYLIVPDDLRPLPRGHAPK
jgi:hypothetical protein